MSAHRPWLFYFATLLAAALLPSCTIFEPGLPAAAITVHGRSTFEVQETLEQVFTADGYRAAVRGLDAITFEKAAGKVDRAVYGNWIEGQVTQRVKVTVVSRGEGRYRIRCMPSVVRDANDVSFEDEQRRVLLYSFHLSGLLRQVDRALR